MWRQSGMEAKPACALRCATSFCTLFLWFPALTSPAVVPVAGFAWTTPAKESIRSATKQERNDGGRQRTRWRTRDAEDLSIRGQTEYLRIWKLLAAPFSIDATVPPAYSEQQLDALVEALQMQEARIYMPREKTHFQSFDLKRHYPSAKRSIAYALTSVTVSRDTPVAMQVRTANSMRVWINGDLVLAHIAPASGRAATTSADLVLEKGENVILVECMQDATTWGFSMGLSVPEQAAGREQKRVASPAPGR